ncbi:MAG: proline dehydrogenase family protein [Thermoanaerobaculum sp.]|nr:proline dehydrogenase family protein [Thermoanaerobaculum sp.]MDW7968146.1 proline dehydrogenase family protein [Thermoanaerobaculum sp.]
MNLVNRLLQTALPLTPKFIVRFFAKRYVAGNTLEDAVATVRRLMAQGCCATIDVLGEAVRNPELAAQAVDAYREVLQVITEQQLNANISVKPTQMGLGISEELALANLRQVVGEAANRGIFVCIDMEDATTTDATFRIHAALRQDFQNVGVVLQSRLRRTLADARRLAQEGINVRLCKGIYLEPRRIAYEEPEIIRWAFVHALEVLFAGKGYVAIATHDEWLIEQSLALADKMGIPANRFEFQMLLGVDPALRRILVGSGHKLRVYVPFGSHWYPYSVRRLRENPNIIRAGLEAFLRRRLDA